MVLRIGKPRRACAAPDALHAALDERIWSVYPSLRTPDPATRKLNYIKAVVAPLIGSQFISKQVPVQAETSFVNDLLSSTQRLSGAEHQIQQAAVPPPQASLEANQTLLPAGLCKGNGPKVCVELKPKCGFLPTAATIVPDHRRLKTSNSRYVLHQRLKLQQGAITRLSDYDPLDLFSVDPSRMRHAIAALLDCPQNNLRLFRDGGPVPFSGDTAELTAAVEGLLASDTEHVGEGLVEVLVRVLLHTGVLRSILGMQQLDVHDIEGIHPLYQAVLAREQPPSDRKCEASAEQHPQIAGSVQSLATDTARQAVDAGSAVSSFANTAVDAEILDARQSLIMLPEAAQLAALRDYLTAATAKDCSIMIALQASTPVHLTAASDARFCGGLAADDGSSPAVGRLSVTEESSIAFKVSVVDLDIKSSAKIAHHYALDQEILRCAG